MIDQLLRSLAPHSCCSCGNLGALLCHQCNYDIISESFAKCLICLTPTSDDNLCRACKKTSLFDAAWCVGERVGPLRVLIDQYKFHSAVEAAQCLRELLDARLPVLPSDMVIIPVPTAPSHRRTRGFDHTRLIAKHLAKSRRLRMRGYLRTERADTQHFKTRSERLTEAYKGLTVSGAVPRHVLLLDDVYTTGATVRSCASLLRSNGATTVSVVVVARQTLDGSPDL